MATQILGRGWFKQRGFKHFATPFPSQTHGERTATPESIKVWPLARCKRCVHPLLSVFKELLPELADNVSPMDGHSGTGIRKMYYIHAGQESL